MALGSARPLIGECVFGHVSSIEDQGDVNKRNISDWGMRLWARGPHFNLAAKMRAEEEIIAAENKMSKRNKTPGAAASPAAVVATVCRRDGVFTQTAELSGLQVTAV